jgi:hypothetical protein
MGERESHDLPQDPEMESRLRWARPQPDHEFVSRLEGQLFVDARALRRAERRSWRPAFAAGFAVAALALLTLALDLAGIGPFGGSGNGPVQASDKCHTVVVTKRERFPLVQKKDGKDTVVFMYKDVQRHVKRCH